MPNLSIKALLRWRTLSFTLCKHILKPLWLMSKIILCSSWNSSWIFDKILIRCNGVRLVGRCNILKLCRRKKPKALLERGFLLQQSRIFPTNYFLMIFFLSIRFCILSLLVSRLFVLVVQYKFLPASQTVEHSNRKEHNRIQCWHSLMMRHKSMSAE